MSFYKVIKDGLIVGVCTNDDFRRYQAKHRIIIVSDPDRVEAVDCGGTLYHDTWMEKPGFSCETATVTRIEDEEYESLKAQLDAGDMPDDTSLEEEVPAEQEPAEEGGEEVRKTAAQILNERILSLEKQIRQAESGADMIADSNIVSGQFFAIGNDLYKATANIASGMAVVVGKNAVRKPISEALNEINA